MEISGDKRFLELSPEPVETVVPEGGDYFPTEIELQAKKKLSPNQNHYFVVEARSDDGKRLSASGRVTVPGLPPLPAKPRVDVNISSELGGNLKPQFNFFGSFRTRVIGSQGSTFRIEPILTYDLGLGQTKSKNALTLDVPVFFKEIDVADYEAGCRTVTRPRMTGARQTIDPRLTDGKEHQVPLDCYSRWSERSPLSLRSIGITAGPKFEANRSFKKINALARTQFTLNFFRWQNSVAEQQRYLALDLVRDPNLRDVWRDIPIDFGFSITPRFGFEAGRKLTGERMSNRSGSVSYYLGPYAIARAFAGIEQIYEINNLPFPLRLSINQDIYFLAATESVADLKGDRLERRDVRGFHPSGKVVLDLFLDRARRYSFTLTYENGRSAPNFEYLNTLKTGIRLVR